MDSSLVESGTRIVTLRHESDNGTSKDSQFYLVDVAGKNIKCKVTNSEGPLSSTINVTVTAFLYPLVSTFGQRDQFHTKTRFFGIGSPAMQDYELDIATGQPVLNSYDAVCFPVNGSGVYSVEWIV